MKKIQKMIQKIQKFRKKTFFKKIMRKYVHEKIDFWRKIFTKSNSEVAAEFKNGVIYLILYVGGEIPK